MKKRQVVLYVFIMIVLLATSVYATISAELKFGIIADDDIFYPGEEFVITIGLKDLTSDGGIKSVEGYINIDENVLEPLTINSIVRDSNGKVQIGTNNTLDVYDASNITSTSEKGIIFNTHPVSEKGDYKLVINLENPIISNMDLVKIKFKIKDNVEAGEYASVMSYQLFKIFSTDAGEKLELQPQSFKITISNPTTPVDNTVDPIDNIPTNNSVDPTNNTPADEPANTPVDPVENKPVNVPANNTVAPVNNKPANNTVKPVNNTPKNNTIKDNTAKKTNNNTITKNKTNNTSGSAGTGTTKGKDSTVSPTNLPKTGYRLMLIPIIALVIVGFVFYKKYSKYNNYHD